MAKTSVRAGVLVTLLGVWPAMLFGQLPGPPPLTGNPTPGTPQPAPPNLADRIALTGCVERADSDRAGGPPTVVDGNTPYDSRYVLTNVRREKSVPPGAGTSSLATAAISQTYRLLAIESALSPFVGTKVEISGAVAPPLSKAADGANANPPTLQVEFVQKLAPNCNAGL